ncbi:MAG: lysylphosphatidylglycerol synthase transmembrane domain-containing protein [Planctomycetota bacterium]
MSETPPNPSPDDAPAPAAGAAAVNPLGPAAPTPTLVNRKKLLLKKAPAAVISFGYLFWVLRSSDLSKTAELFLDADWLLAFVFVIVTPGFTLISAYKWKVLLDARGAHFSLEELFKLYIIGQFYNNLLPSSAGGDVVRTAVLRKRCGSGEVAVSSVLMERFTGLVVLVLLSALALVLAWDELRGETKLMAYAITGTAVGPVVMALAISRRCLRLAQRMTSHLKFTHGPMEKIAKVQSTLWMYMGHREAMAKAMFASIGFYALAILTLWLACHTLGVPVSATDAALAMPIVMAIILLPISINGIGLLEWSLKVCLARLGYGDEIGFAAALIIRARDLAWSALGYFAVTHYGLVKDLRTAAAAAKGQPPPPSSVELPPVDPAASGDVEAGMGGSRG